MGLSIDTYLLCSLFNISTKKLDTEYSGMSIEEIMAAEKKAGNSSVADFDASILSDPSKLIELFELKDPANKYAILSNMNSSDLENMLPMLQDQDLIQGLNYFSKDKLLQQIGNMPQNDMLNYTFSVFSDAHIMQMMPEAQMNNMLKSTDIDKKQELKYLPTVAPAAIACMIQKTTGQKADGVGDVGMDGQQSFDVEAMVNQMKNMKDDKFQETLLNMPTENKRSFLYKMATDNPNLYKNVSTSTYLSMMDQKKDKQALLRGASVISSNQLVKMVSNLPKELTAVVLTQLDTNKFAGVLQSKFKNVISQMASA